MLGVALAATLGGTALTLLLHHLLRPIALTAHALRRYLSEGELPALPTDYADLVGMLMADTRYVLGRLDRTIRTLGEHDEVTGLPNRQRFLQDLREHAAAATASPFAVCTIRLDGLEPIVSAFGGRMADRVLRLAVRRLESALEREERLHRLDVTTLAVVLETAEPDRVSDRLAGLDACLGALREEGFGLELRCRSGVSLGPLDDTDADALLDDALVALELAERRREPLTFYSETSRRALIERFTLLRDLRRALDAEPAASEEDTGLALHFQPIVDTARGAIVGAEALLRWRHPHQGTLPPARFVPLAGPWRRVLAPRRSELRADSDSRVAS